MATISIVYARVITRHLLGQDIESSRVFAGTSVDYPSLYALDEIDLEAFRQILENAEKLLPDPPVGFVIGSFHGALALGQLGVALGSAPTVLTGLQVLESFTRLHATYGRLELESRLKRMRIRFDFQDLENEVLRHHVEATMLFFQRHLEAITGQALDDATHYVTYPAPSYAERYGDFVRSPVCFDHDFNGLDIPQAWMSLRSPYFNRAVYAQSQRDLAHQLQVLGESESDVYTGHVLAQLRSYAPPLIALADIAGRLHISERTLNRKLQAEGTNFRELRGQLLDKWARRYLSQTTDSVESIAASLGYQDAANFRRAFRKRTGITPSEYRDNARQETNLISSASPSEPTA